MKEVENGWFHFELAEIIRLNQLVRERIDLQGFDSWYRQLSPPEQCALIYQLFEFAYQAGVDESIWDGALTAAGIGKNNPLAWQAGSFMGEPFNDWSSFHHFVAQLTDSDRSVFFLFSVHLFGRAEGRAYQNEDPEWCNHWWHRDLTDARVVRDILDDPRFYMTSMKDDARVKGNS